MLNYFKINDPYRFVVIILMLLLVRIPVFLDDIPLLTPELHWMIIGEKLSAGFSMYLDVWDHTAPLAAGVYWLLDEIFGRSALAYRILAIVFVIIQGIIFNSIFLKSKAFNENTYVPGLIYVALMNLFFDFFTLSPVLMSITFILLSVDKLLMHLENKSKDTSILSKGLYIGIATLFYAPSAVFLLCTLFVYLFYTATPLKRYLLLIYGFFFPIFIVWIYYFIKGAMYEFHYCYFKIYSLANARMFISFPSFLVIALIPAIFLFFSISKSLYSGRQNVSQLRIQQIMFLMLLVGAGSLFITYELSPYQLIIIVPWLGYFISSYFILLQRQLVAEMAIFAFLGGMVAINLGSLYNWQAKVEFSELFVKSTKWDEKVKNKKVLVIGDDLNVYKNSHLATPYLDWSLSEEVLKKSNYYDNLTAIFINFKKDAPQIIIDKEKLAAKILARMPTIGSRYEKTGEDIYELKD